VSSSPRHRASTSGGLFRIVRRTFNTALALVILGAFAVMAGGYLLGFRTFVVRTGSMGNAAPPGSVAVVRPVPSTQVKVGDVIIMKPPTGTTSMPVLHRVVELTRTEGAMAVRTKGDANLKPDPKPYVLQGTTLVLTAVAPRVGFLISAAQTQNGWWGLVVLPATIIALIWLRVLWASGGSRKPAKA